MLHRNFRATVFSPSSPVRTRVRGRGSDTPDVTSDPSVPLVRCRPHAARWCDPERGVTGRSHRLVSRRPRRVTVSDSTGTASDTGVSRTPFRLPVPPRETFTSGGPGPRRVVPRVSGFHGVPDNRPLGEDPQSEVFHGLLQKPTLSLRPSRTVQG